MREIDNLARYLGMADFRYAAFKLQPMPEPAAAAAAEPEPVEVAVAEVVADVVAAAVAEAVATAAGEAVPAEPVAQTPIAAMPELVATLASALGIPDTVPPVRRAPTIPTNPRPPPPRGFALLADIAARPGSTLPAASRAPARAIRLRAPADPKH